MRQPMLRWRMLRQGGHQRVQVRVVGLQRAADVDEVLAEQAVEKRALLGSLSDDAGLTLLWMHVDVGAGDVDVAAQDDLAPFVVQLLRPRGEAGSGSRAWRDSPCRRWARRPRRRPGCRAPVCTMRVSMSNSGWLNSGPASTRFFLMWSDTPE
mgnify:CR=1 FL=1